jgi:hypothetical protein
VIDLARAGVRSLVLVSEDTADRPAIEVLPDVLALRELRHCRPGYLLRCRPLRGE